MLVVHQIGLPFSAGSVESALLIDLRRLILCQLWNDPKTKEVFVVDDKVLTDCLIRLNEEYSLGQILSILWRAFQHTSLEPYRPFLTRRLLQAHVTLNVDHLVFKYEALPCTLTISIDEQHLRRYITPEIFTALQVYITQKPPLKQDKSWVQVLDYRATRSCPKRASTWSLQ